MSQDKGTFKMENTDALTKFQVLLMAFAAGASVANIYYNQPILKDISLTFDVTESKAGTISMLSQIGYGLGLFFIIPLGDKISKKNIILILLSLLIVTLLLNDRCFQHSSSLDFKYPHRNIFRIGTGYFTNGCQFESGNQGKNSWYDFYGNSDWHSGGQGI